VPAARNCKCWRRGSAGSAGARHPGAWRRHRGPWKRRCRSKADRLPAPAWQRAPRSPIAAHVFVVVVVVVLTAHRVPSPINPEAEPVTLVFAPAPAETLLDTSPAEDTAPEPTPPTLPPPPVPEPPPPEALPSTEQLAIPLPEPPPPSGPDAATGGHDSSAATGTVQADRAPASPESFVAASPKQHGARCAGASTDGCRCVANHTSEPAASGRYQPRLADRPGRLAPGEQDLSGGRPATR
jgi:hypothetical protein